MAAFTNYSAYDGIGLAELVARGEVTPGELLEAAIERIEAVNPELNAIVHRMYRHARASIEAGLPDGPFRGVPFLIKDLIALYEGVPTTGSARYYENDIATHDSELVRRYRSAGLVIVAKTNTPELGLVPVTESDLRGPTHTPWRLGYNSGGSSGGAAASVAAGIVPIAHGGDGGGSIRIPASCCGIFGFKPSRGLNPNGPDCTEHWRGLAVEHVLSRSVRDSAAMLDVTAGPDPMAWYPVEKASKTFRSATQEDGPRLRIAFTSSPFMPADVHRDCVAAVEDAAKLCESLGHRVEARSIDIDPVRFATDFLTNVAVSTAASIAFESEARGRPATRRDFEETTWILKMLGESISAVAYETAFLRLQEVTRKVNAAFGDFDVLLTPTLGLPPVRNGQLSAKGFEAQLQKVVIAGNLRSIFRIRSLVEQLASKVYAFIPFTPLANVTGQPSMSVPLMWNAQNLPIGAMFTGRIGEDRLLFGLAAELERARPWKNRRPIVHAF
jgi:amidase